MKKAKIYIPSKSAMQSGKGKNDKWLLEFNNNRTENDHLMNWISSNDTQSQVKIFFNTKDEAIAYAKKNNIKFDIIEPKKSKLIIKSYADNFLTN
jgi:hypothetical protein